MSEWLPYEGTWKGNILEAIIIKSLRFWNEILDETGLLPEQLNTALSELFEEGVIQKNDDGSYWVIPEIYGAYKRHYEGFSISAEEADKESNIVFVVYGRNEEARNALFAFLRSIGVHPLEFSEAILKTGEAAPYIGNILNTAFSLARAVIVLMTPDDEARLREHYRKPQDSNHETHLTPQARPNVLFEAGMALGRFPKRTILVELGVLRPFSDISGRHVIRLDNSEEKRRDLAQRLEVAGCQISLEGTDWRTTGNFEATMPKGETTQTEKNGEVENKPSRKTETQKIVLLPDNSKMAITAKDEKIIKQLAQDPLIHQKIIRSIAPNVIGLQDVKEAITFLLFGGSSRDFPDIHVRKNIHVLLIGDADTNIGELLRFTAKLIPEWINISGKDLSKIMNFPVDGVCCINNLNFMKRDDLIILQQIIENNEVQVVKGGTVSLADAKCSMLALSSPVTGIYDYHRTIMDNVSLPMGILTLFDLIFIIGHEPISERDAIVAEQIMDLHTTANGSKVIPIERQLLRKYLQYSKQIKPVLTEDARKRLVAAYLWMRSLENERSGSITITSRHLESLIRLAESCAKVCLRKEVTVEYAEAAILLMMKSLEQLGIII